MPLTQKNGQTRDERELAFLQGEVGFSAVQEWLDAGGVCGTAHWSEIALKVRAHGRICELAGACFKRGS
jgi:hypothetical protein